MARRGRALPTDGSLAARRLLAQTADDATLQHAGVLWGGSRDAALAHGDRARGAYSRRLVHGEPARRGIRYQEDRADPLSQGAWHACLDLRGVEAGVAR